MMTIFYMRGGRLSFIFLPGKMILHNHKLRVSIPFFSKPRENLFRLLHVLLNSPAVKQ